MAARKIKPNPLNLPPRGLLRYNIGNVAKIAIILGCLVVGTGCRKTQSLAQQNGFEAEGGGIFGLGKRVALLLPYTLPPEESHLLPAPRESLDATSKPHVVPLDLREVKQCWYFIEVPKDETEVSTLEKRLPKFYARAKKTDYPIPLSVSLSEITRHPKDFPTLNSGLSTIAGEIAGSIGGVALANTLVAFQVCSRWLNGQLSAVPAVGRFLAITACYAAIASQGSEIGKKVGGATGRALRGAPEAEQLQVAIAKQLAASHWETSYLRWHELQELWKRLHALGLKPRTPDGQPPQGEGGSQQPCPSGSEIVEKGLIDFSQVPMAPNDSTPHDTSRGNP